MIPLGFRVTMRNMREELRIPVDIQEVMIRVVPWDLWEPGCQHLRIVTYTLHTPLHIYNT